MSGGGTSSEGPERGWPAPGESTDPVRLGKGEDAPAPGVWPPPGPGPTGPEPPAYPPAGPPAPGGAPAPGFLPPGYPPPGGFPPPGGEAPPPHGPPPAYAPPYGSAGGYPPPYWPPGPPPYGKRTNGLAIAALVLAILSVAMCPVFAPVAVIVGFVARRQIAQRDEEGGVLAVIGMVIGGIVTVAMVAVIVLVVVLGATSTQTSQRDPVRRSPTTFAPQTRPTVGGTATTVRPFSGASSPLCIRLQLAVLELALPESSTTDQLNDAAQVLQRDLSGNHRADIELVLVDGLGRAGRGRQAPSLPSASVAAANERLTDAVQAQCPG